MVIPRALKYSALSAASRVDELSSEVKIYRIEGVMLISHGKYPTWQKFVKEVRALNEKQAVEKVYSILGGSHKLKRYHIKIEKISEIPPEEVTRRELLHLIKLTRLIKK